MKQVDKDHFLINPAILKWARIWMGYNLEEAAKRLGTSVEILQTWEQGNKEAPLKKLKKFSEVYKRSTSVFLLNTVPEENISPKFRKMIYDNISSFSTDTLLAIRKAIRIQTLSKEIIGGQNNNFLLSLRERISFEDYNKDALEIIKSLGLTQEDITRPKNIYEQLNLWKNAIEANGIYVLELGFPENEARGFAIYDDACPIIVLNTNDYAGVRIFTLLHELSHFLLGTNAIDDSTTLFDYTSSYQMEVKCNNLAGNILVPSSYLKQKIDQLNLEFKDNIDASLEVLSRVFHTSNQAILRRLYVQKFIEKEQFTRIHNFLRKSFLNGSPEGKRATGGNFYIKFIKNNSRAFIYDVFEAYRVNKIGYQDLINILSVKGSTLSNLESRL